MSDPVSAVARDLAEIGRLVDDDDLDTALSRYIDRVVTTVPGCDHAAITVRTEHGPQPVATNLPAAVTENSHRPTVAVGPIGEVLAHREPRYLGDTRVDERWPAYSALLRRAGLRSCLALPLPANRTRSAAFSLYSRTPAQFDSASHDLILLFTLHAGSTFDNVSTYHHCRSLVTHLEAALDNRTTIGRAQGLLMRHHDTSTDDAFDHLRTISQRHNTKLRDIATQLVTAQDNGKFASVLSTLTSAPTSPSPS
ncbi:GAF and ANTAR domain-containing protein [Amycolatopsis magusensis]|uniref:GAF domain-containing protein n=1 Tax=Amycolatopsis magusensis TaxID=882444 RepID=A0ABS4PYH0_9PSEU|nr:GAF and ANTAR domain-containing protein [Amycolatopsis magusensis]MBP2184476.1 GAF domain-containing protein [Amycolatopsis magusensis]MDI5975617.1 GAF and ANTAR domain-containing protein [Amycolatopsis magusensis]